jgi:radical SAM protein with 4Fe4S-binding SPASM domain
MGLQEIIPSTMGEPLLYKHFAEIIEICREQDVKLNLTTNGTFPIKGARAWAELLVPITSDVKISWNGATKSTQEHIMRGANWEKVINNVKEFIAVRDAHAMKGGNYCRATFQLTFLKENIDELPQIIQLAANLGIDRVKGHHLWAHFNEIKSSSLRLNADTVAKWNETVKLAIEMAEKVRLPNGKTVLLENIVPLDIEPVDASLSKGQCPFLGKEAWVATDGRFNPCCAPEQERRTLGDFGNLNQVPLEEIWQSAAYQTLKESYDQQPVCQKCNMRKFILS